MTILDDLAPADGAFAHALRWARTLRLPLCGVSLLDVHSTPNKLIDHLFPRVVRQPAPVVDGQVRGSWPMDAMNEACAVVCRHEGVEWHSLRCDGPSLQGLLGDHGQGPLWVVSRRIPTPVLERIVHGRASGNTHALLVCPERIRMVSRALIVNDAHHPDGTFLQSATSLCRRLGAAPVVLTVARSERSSRRGTALALAALQGSGLGILLDSLVGLGVRTAIGRIARWRRCQLVMMNPQPLPWWDWRRGTCLPRLVNWLPDLSFLAVPPGMAAGLESLTRSAGVRDPTRDPSNMP